MPRHPWRWNRPTAYTRNQADHPVGLRTLLVGSGSAGRTMARELRAHPDYGLIPIGFLDDDPAATTLGRLRVLGSLGELAMVVRRHRVEVVVVAIPSLPAARMATVLSDAVHSGAKVRYLPSFHAAIQRPSRAGDLLDVPTGALLGRDEVQRRPPADPSGGGGSTSTGHRGRWIDRQRALPPDPLVSPRLRCTCSTTTSPTCTGCSWR